MFNVVILFIVNHKLVCKFCTFHFAKVSNFGKVNYLNNQLNSLFD